MIGEIIIVIFVLWILESFISGLFKSGNDNQKVNTTEKKETIKEQEKKDSEQSYPNGFDNFDDYLNDISSHTRNLIDQYKKAYDTLNEKELDKIAADLIHEHYSAASSHKIDACCLLESEVAGRPYIYHGYLCYSLGIDEKEGMELIEIFRKQNKEIYERDGYVTPD